MNPRLTRPLLAAVVCGALAAGGAVFAAPANAGAPVSSVGSVLADDPSGDPSTTASDAAPSADPSSSGPSADPSSSSPSADPSSSSATPPDTSPPTGRFTLNTAGLWIGQSVILTQVDIADNGVADPASVTRVVDWGDGTSTNLSAGQGPVAKQYTQAGTFPVTLTLTDGAGLVTTAKSTVTVSVPGKFAFSTTSVWPGQVFKVTISAVPAGTTKIIIDGGDGYVGSFRGVNQTVSNYYYHRKNGPLIHGWVTLRATFANQYGTTSWITIGRVNVRTDSWNPTVKVNMPKAANRVSSWKTIAGTSSDKGSGAPYVYVWVTRVVGSQVYCYQTNKTWRQVHNVAEYDKYCLGLPVKVGKNKWSLALTGLKKGGTLYVDAQTWDWADRASKVSSVSAKITSN